MDMKGIIKATAARLAGVQRLQGEVDVLFFFLDSYADIENVPVAKGELRELQVCGYEMLRIFDRLCRRFNLEYWIDFGTLLGAARHGGYIPWDDDLDVSMVRDQWNRAAEVLPAVLLRMGFYVRVYSESWFGFGYKRDKTGLWMDVFCYEAYYASKGEADLARLHNVIDKQLRFARRHRTFNTRPGISREKMKANRLRTVYSELLEHDGEVYYFESPEHECGLSHNLYSEKDIFPLSRLSFEGEEFPVPRNWQKMLTCSYGDYMRFPRSGLTHHGLEGVSLKDVATYNSVDMRAVLEELRELLAAVSAPAG